MVLVLARSHWLTVYDAAYLELAVRIDFPLAMLDRKLAAAVRAAGVPLVGGCGVEANRRETRPCAGARSGS
jgi:hypothetical protein